MAHIAIGQNSLLTLYKNVEVTAGLELVFSSPAQRAAYFDRRLLKHYTDMSYVYRNGVVKIQDTPQVVARSNFISFTNPSFENKTIYARIIDYNYVNNATVEITYAVDYWLTFMFDVSFRSCQIMREHLSEPDYQKALSNPWRHDVLELETDESFNFTPEDYKHIDLNDSHYFPFASDNDKLYAVIVTGWVKGVKQDGKPAAGYEHLYSWTGKFQNLPADTSGITNFHGYKLKTNFRNDIPNACVAWVVGGDVTAIGLEPWEDRVLGDISFLQYGLDSLSESGQSSTVVGIYLVSGDFIRSAVNALNFNPSATGKTTPGDPKLSRFPFSYMRVTTPDTGEKEYHYEQFRDPKDMRFTVLSTLNTNGASYLLPINYNYYTTGTSAGVIGWNPSERMEYRNIPQLGYNVDGFLTYMSNVYADARAWKGSTESPMQKMGKIAEGVNLSTMLPLAASGHLPAAAAGAAAGSASILSYDMQMRNAAAYSGVEGSKPYYDYSAEKARYVASSYTPGSYGAGLLAIIERVRFEAFFMTLNDGNQEKANNYLTMFGYNSGRIGIPRVCNLITGEGQAPHFVTWDGAPCTYVQTADMRVISTMKPASDYIEQIFNSGHRFIKGDGR